MISESDLEISRHRITVFLSTHMTYELLPESGKVRMTTACSNVILSHLFSLSIVGFVDLLDWLQVIALDVDLPVKQAFHILHEQVLSLGICGSMFFHGPLWINVGRYCYCITIRVGITF